MALGDFLFPQLNAKLVIGHSFESDIESVNDKFSEEYSEKTALVKLNDADMKRLSVKDGMSVEIESETAMVVVRAIGDPKVPNEMALMVHGPWAMALVKVPNGKSPPQLHGIKVSIKKSQDEITSIQSLLEP